MSDNVEAKLREMAKLTILSNRLSEVHEKNLKMYPLVFFNNVRKVTIGYDFSQLEIKMDDKEQPKRNAGLVEFCLDLSLDGNDNLDKRFSALEMATRNLFWPTTKVKVYLNNELKFESKDGK